MESKKLKNSAIVVALLILISIIAIAIQSFADVTTEYVLSDENAKYVRLKTLRKNPVIGYATKENLQTHPIWNLVMVNNQNEDEELSLYCVQPGLGFTNEAQTSKEKEKYSSLFEMKLLEHKAEIARLYGSSNLEIARDDTKYARVIWLADNMFAPKQGAEEKNMNEKIAILRKAGILGTENNNSLTLDEKASVVNDLCEIGIIDRAVFTLEDTSSLSAEELAQYRQKVEKLFDSQYSISDDVMEVVQQLVFWDIIEKDNAFWSSEEEPTLPDLYITETEDDTIDDFSLLSDGLGTITVTGVELGERYQTKANKLYQYYISNLKNINASYLETSGVMYNTSSKREVPVVFKDNADITITSDENNNYIVGPYKIERTAVGSFELEENISVDNFTVLKADKQTEVDSISAVVEDAVGEYEFYLSIPNTENISGLSVTITTGRNNKIIELLLGDDPTNQQPVLWVEDNPNYRTKTVTLEKIFDLALRKVITKVEDKNHQPKLITNANGEGNSRIKNGHTTIDIDVSKINTVIDGVRQTTAIYKHRKDPVLVEKGDFVEYTLIIYNEGDVAGRATKIVDALPEGLKFDSVVSGDYTATVTPNGKFVTLTKTGTNNISAFNGTTLNKEEVVIRCEVTADASAGEKILTNIAAITEAYNAETETVITNQVGLDRDSEPSTVPTQATTGNTEAYTGNSSNQENLGSNDYFYKGEQDDDDFEKIVLKNDNFDLALRKFITEVETKDENNTSTVKEYDRAPDVKVENILNEYKEGKLITTAEYEHPKTPVSVKVGDIVTYTIRVYNEGDIDGYVAEITDYLPQWLEFLPTDELNVKYLWEYKNEGNTRVIKTEITAKNNATGQLLYETEDTDTYRENGQLLKAYNPETHTLDYIDVKIRCKVIGTIGEDELKPGVRVTNIAAITKMTDTEGTEITTDRDSTTDGSKLTIPSDEDLPAYKDEEINTGKAYIPGQEDDDDFEKVIIQVFDLALRKYITKVDDGRTVTTYNDRKPVITKGTEGRDLNYTHPKDPVGVKHDDLVTYTIRVFNEGDVDGYAKVVADTIPDGLQFESATVDGENYRWIMYKEVSDSSTYEFEYQGKKYARTTEKTEAKLITTDYLSKAQETATGRINLLKAFDKNDFETNGAKDTAELRNPDYRDLKVIFKVTEPNTSTRILTNIAEIKDDEDAEGNEVEDEDSTPGNDNFNFDRISDNEDDIDFDRVKLLYFDFALRKFITEVEGEPVNDRIPVVKEGTEGRDFDYEHKKTPVDVISGNTVIYTIRVFNEGINPGYIAEVMDDIPQGLEFLPDHDTNIEYRWEMYKEVDGGAFDYEYADKKYKKVTDAKEADIIVTDYLSKEVSDRAGRDSLIKAYDASKGITNDNPDYRDLKVAFKVVEPNSSDRIIINTAEITKHQDKDGNTTIKDKDSTPGNGDLQEDDIDKEYLKVKEFDLALLKWVSKVSVTQDGKTKITETGHTVDTARNEEPVLVTIDEKKLDSVVVKFIYTIRVENQAEIEGYAKEIKDHIPEGLKFVQEDNPDWKQIDDKTITTDKLKGTLLKPNDTAEVEVVLTWINGSKNLNTKINYAEISKDYNEWGVPDRDSTPDNMDLTRDYEDDEDDAPVLLTLKTGQLPVYFLLGTGILVVFAGGIYLIKKYVYKA